MGRLRRPLRASPTPRMDDMTRYKAQIRSFWRAMVVSFLVAPLVAIPAANAAPPLPPDLDPLVQNMDPKVNPRDDFFQYANGRWLREHPIPASERRWGIGELVNEETYRQRLGICQSTSRSGAPRGTSEQRVGDC